jgi:hypothetical protein
MAMAVDSPWKHKTPARIDLARACPEPGAERRDPSVAHTDIGIEGFARGGDTAAAND